MGFSLVTHLPAHRYAGAWASAAADYAVRVDASEKKLEDLLRDLKEAFAANGGAGGNSGGSGSAGKLLAELAGNSLAEVSCGGSSRLYVEMDLLPGLIGRDRRA